MIAYLNFAAIWCDIILYRLRLFGFRRGFALTQSGATYLTELAQAQFDVFLSHNWGNDAASRDNHLRVATLARKLRAAGLKPWLDEEQMGGDIINQMSQGIESSKVVCVFITKLCVSAVHPRLPAPASAPAARTTQSPPPCAHALGAPVALPPSMIIASITITALHTPMSFRRHPHGHSLASPSGTLTSALVWGQVSSMTHARYAYKSAPPVTNLPRLQICLASSLLTGMESRTWFDVHQP